MRARLLLVCVATGAALLVPARTWAAAPSVDAEDPGSARPPPSAVDVYERNSKSPAAAIALSLLLPGAGSVYGDHFGGAMIVWTLIGAGAGAIAWTAVFPDQHGDTSSPNMGLVLGGLLLVTAGELYGLVDAYTATADYNDRLANRLGLSGGLALGVQPVVTGAGARTWGPALSLRF